MSSVQSLSRVRFLATPWTTAHQASLSITSFWGPPKYMYIKSMMPSNHLILCRPLLLLPSIFPSVRVFSNESILHIRWPKYWSFSFNISPSKNTQDWSPLAWTGGSPCSPRDSHESSPTPQIKSINSSALSFLYSPNTHPYMTTGKTIALTKWTFVGIYKLMSLLLMLSRFAIAFLPRIKHLLLLWLQS